MRGFYLKSDLVGTRTQDPYIKSVLLYQLSYEINVSKNIPLFLSVRECKDRQILFPAKYFSTFFSAFTKRPCLLRVLAYIILSAIF